MSLRPGDRLGPYEIEQVLGAGGMGVVFRALDTRLNRSVAIKILPEHITDEADRVRFQREAQAVAALSHPNVLSVFDVGTRGGDFYIVTELLEGSTLRERLRSGPLPRPVALEWARQAAVALQAAHAKGIVHRDIKPENLFITADGRVKVLDFGLAALMVRHDAPTVAHEQVRLTAPDTVLGTVGYMSPEQIRGETLDHRSDIFSLGCVLFEMIGGRPPFARASQTATIAAILNDTPDFRSLTDVSPRLAGILSQCLAKDPVNRFESAAAFAAALQEASSREGAVRRARASVAQRLRRPLALVAFAAVALVVLAGILMMFRREPPPAAPQPGGDQRVMLAVLPFENLSGDPSEEYFSDGLTEDAITEFGRLSADRLGVIARTSVMRYKKAHSDVRAVGRELGVDYLVSGSVRRAGNRLRVTAQLVRASDGTEMWADMYDRTLDDVFAIQSELARNVAAAVRIKVIPAPAAARRHPAPRTPAAHDAFLRGRHHLALGTPDDRRKSVEYMEDAVAADPESALAHTELARALLSLSTLDFAPREIVPKAREEVEQALRLDDGVPEAHDVLGTMLLEYYWDWVAAERELKRAIALDPNFARAYATYATLLVSGGRADEGIAYAAQARKLDPLALTQHRNHLLQLFAARRWDDALARAREVIRQEPKYDFAHAVAALAHSERGEKDAAIAEAEQVINMTTVPVPRAMAAYVLAINGRIDQARSLLAELRAAAEKRFVCFFNVATVHAALGQREETFASLNRAIRDKSG
jgi:eukaryotic-like serine/threonine-protein kinase